MVREEEGLSSNHQELFALWECLETHQDHENLLYLTDSEVTLHVINKLETIHESRKRQRIYEDGLFRPHQKGPITSTFTADWFLREGEGRELLGEWMKMTSVRSQDQRRMVQVNSHTFPTNVWIHKITKRGTEKDLPDQNLGHIQHTCEDLSVAHIDAHHQC